MADKLMRAQVTIPLDSAIPEDSIVNTFYFDGDDLGGGLTTDAEYHGAVQSLLTAFYQSIDGNMLANSVTTPATVKIYDMRDPTPRVPEFTFTIGLTDTAQSPLPGEVALCASFQADLVSGVNQARRRGRVYIGPLASTASFATVVNGQLRPHAAVVQALADACNVLADGIDTTGNGAHVSWAVYSPTLDIAGTIDDAFNDVTNGWVDNSYDTQRRRGAAPTSRVTWT